MTTLTQEINQSNDQVTVTNKEPNGQVATGTKANLHHGDALKLVKGSGWRSTDSIGEICFYDTAQKTNRIAHWTSGGTSEGLTDRFRVSSDATSVTLTDIEPEGEQDMWYSVKLGEKWMDPEVINKGGSATSGDPTAWIE